MGLIKRALKKLFISRWYHKYVEHNEVIQQDVINTVRVRGSKINSESLFKQYSHLMMYYPEFAYIFFWRINKPNSYQHWLFPRQFESKIFRSTQIDGGLMCFHPFATVINAKTIGKNFQFRNGLTIGNKDNDNDQLPVIGNNVTVGSQVVIIGGITIGNNVTIGAGSVVVKDVASNSVVAGNPAKLIHTSVNG